MSFLESVATTATLDVRSASPRQRRRQDRRAVAALRNHAPEAMALVMEVHGRAILGFLTQMLADRSTAEDVLQQVLIEVWERGTSYDPERAGLLTWVLTIARSRAIDELRRRVPEPIDPAGLTNRLEAANSAESETDQLLEQWRIAGLLARLPRQEANLLRMRFYEGLSQSEVAERTDLALGTVKTKMVEQLPEQAWMEPDTATTVRPAGNNARRPSRKRRTRFTPVGAGVFAAVALAFMIGALIHPFSGTTRSHFAISRTSAHVVLTPLTGARTTGQAVAYMPGGDHMLVRIHDLPRSAPGTYYELWLMTSTTHLVSVTSFRIRTSGTDSLKLLLPDDPSHYKYLDISVQHVGDHGSISNDNVLRGPIHA